MKTILLNKVADLRKLVCMHLGLYFLTDSSQHFVSSALLLNFGHKRVDEVVLIIFLILNPFGITCGLINLQTNFIRFYLPANHHAGGTTFKMKFVCLNRLKISFSAEFLFLFFFIIYQQFNESKRQPDSINNQSVLILQKNMVQFMATVHECT